MRASALPPDDVYRNTVSGVARRLRRLAEDVERMGRPGQSLESGLPDHLTPALNVVNRVQTELARIGLVDLVLAAVLCDHPTARFTPAQLLDKGIAALEALVAGMPDEGFDGEGVPSETMAAEAVLRGAEVLR